MDETRTFDAVKAIAAQQNYCAEHDQPCFIPGNGWCYRCGRNIFEPYEGRNHEGRTLRGSISVREAGDRLITCCPHCGGTFVE